MRADKGLVFPVSETDELDSRLVGTRVFVGTVGDFAGVASRTSDLIFGVEKSALLDSGIGTVFAVFARRVVVVAFSKRNLLTVFAEFAVALVVELEYLLHIHYFIVLAPLLG